MAATVGQRSRPSGDRRESGGFRGGDRDGELPAGGDRVRAVATAAGVPRRWLPGGAVAGAPPGRDGRSDGEFRPRSASDGRVVRGRAYRWAPALPDDMVASDLDSDRSGGAALAAKPVAETVARHLVATGQLIDEDPSRGAGARDGRPTARLADRRRP